MRGGEDAVIAYFANEIKEWGGRTDKCSISYLKQLLARIKEIIIDSKFNNECLLSGAEETVYKQIWDSKYEK